MGKLVVSENVSVDGVVEDPSGSDGFDRGGWVGRVGDHGRDAAAQRLLDEVLDAAAVVLGRRTYEFFAGRWPDRSGRLADRLNSMPKHVVSSTLITAAWNNSAVIAGDAIGQVADLKAAVDGDVVVYGSVQLATALLGHGLVDELRLITYPVVLGDGRRLFEPTDRPFPLRLVHVEPLGDLTFSRYDCRA